jgi:hypothetical protein
LSTIIRSTKGWPFNLDHASLLTLVRYERLKAQLVEGQNPETNTDKGVLISRSAALGFPAEVEQVLQEIDSNLSTADSGFDYKACIGDIRTLWRKCSSTLRNAFRRFRVAHLPKAESGTFNETKGYLVSSELLPEKEGSAVQGLYSFASEDGAHAFTSAPEQARVAKNCVIEWSLLVVGRVQKYVSSSARSASLTV